MKIKNILAITALLGLGMSAQAITFDFLSNGANVALGSQSTFTVGGASLTAYASPGATLYAKDFGAGSNEQGLGITSDPTGDNEIWGQTFVQLLSSTSSGAFAVDMISFGSTSDGELSNVYYSTTLGILGSLIGSFNSNTTFAIASQYQDGYLAVAAGGSTGTQEPANVLLGAVTGHVPDGGTTVAMLGGALTALGLIRRKLVA